MTTTNTVRKPRAVQPEPQVPVALLKQLREIYSEYTGYEVADAIRIIRQELEAQREELSLDEEISRLLLKRVKITN